MPASDPVLMKMVRVNLHISRFLPGLASGLKIDSQRYVDQIRDEKLRAEAQVLVDRMNPQ